MKWEFRAPTKRTDGSDLDNIDSYIVWVNDVQQENRLPGDATSIDVDLPPGSYCVQLQTVDSLGNVSALNAKDCKTVESQNPADPLPPEWSGTVLPPAIPPEGVLFYDDFSSGGLGSSENGCSWWYGSPQDPYPTPNAVVPVVNSVRPDVSANSLEFFFAGTSTGLGEQSMAQCEQRFFIGGRPSELWIRYSIYIPENYKNRGYYGGGLNNKLMYLDGPPDSGWYMGFETWPSNTTNGQEAWGAASAYITHNKKNENHVGHDHDLIQPFADSRPPYVKTSQDLGMWHEFVFHVKIASTTSAKDGAIEIWKNGKKIMELLNYDNGVSTNSYFASGYIQGWQNSGYDSDTYCYIDGFTLSLNPINATPGYPHR